MFRLLTIFCTLALQCLFGQYYSQMGQDKYLNEQFFKNMKGGTFVEFGAYDGLTISNSLFFENELGWTGICLEPLPEHFANLRTNRKCICIQGCVGPKSGVVDFLKINGGHWYNQMLSGVVSAYDPRHLNRIEQEVKDANTQKVYANKEIIKVPCYRLADLLDQYKMPHINYLSIDTEGGELEILQSIDFKKYQIDLISVEDNYGDAQLRQFLESQGFEFVKKLECDLIFKNKSATFASMGQ